MAATQPVQRLSPHQFLRQAISSASEWVTTQNESWPRFQSVDVESNFREKRFGDVHGNRSCAWRFGIPNDLLVLYQARFECCTASQDRTEVLRANAESRKCVEHDAGLEL